MKCCDVHAGLIREPVTFQRASRSSDGAGGSTQSWGSVSGTPTRAFVKPTGGTELYQHDRVEAIPRLKVVVRYFSGLLESDRVLIRSKAHDIIRIDNVEFKNKWLEITVNGGSAA